MKIVPFNSSTNNMNKKFILLSKEAEFKKSFSELSNYFVQELMCKTNKLIQKKNEKKDNETKTGK